MRGPLLLLLAAATASTGLAQSIPSPGEFGAAGAPPPPATDSSAAAPPPAAPAGRSERGSAAASQAAMEHLMRANQELLDLLKKQQAVLEDIQYDRRLQNRQITLLEQRLEDTLQLNASLEAKEARLEATLEARNAAPAPAGQAADTVSPTKSDETAAPSPPPPPPAPPASTLPPEQADGAPGTLWWHRVLSLSGEDSKDTDAFHISGKQWRVLWHNQDKPGDTYKNTSALFISAFPKNDALPKRICSQLGTGGDSTELAGTGDYYLKVEASGGAWELAVEDFR